MEDKLIERAEKLINGVCTDLREQHTFNLIRDLLAAIQAKQGEWLPISEAPRDLKRILLWREGHIPLIGYCTKNLGVWWEVTEGESIPAQWEATHYCALPSPPTGEAPKSEEV